MLADNWYEFLAIMPYVALTTWALLVAGAFLTMIVMGAVGRHYMWGVATFVLLATFFFSLAITGGSTPFISRRQLAIPIRLVSIGMLLTGYGWIVLWSRTYISVENKSIHVQGEST